MGKSVFIYAIAFAFSVLALSACGNPEPAVREAEISEIGEQEFPVPQYILENEIIVHMGQRDALMEILEAGTRNMPGNYAYRIEADPDNPDRILITEIWDSSDSHQNSLSLPAVQETIAKGRPLIKSMNNLSVGQKLARPR